MRIHSPQSIQRSVNITAFPPRTLIASVGQFLIQLVQPWHFSSSRTTEWYLVSTISPHGCLFKKHITTFVPRFFSDSMPISSVHFFMFGRPDRKSTRLNS